VSGIVYNALWFGIQRIVDSPKKSWTLAFKADDIHQAGYNVSRWADSVVHFANLGYNLNSATKLSDALEFKAKKLSSSLRCNPDNIRVYNRRQLDLCLMDRAFALDDEDKIVDYALSAYLANN
jgi:hypothetical protein